MKPQVGINDFSIGEKTNIEDFIHNFHQKFW